jgi:DNA-directed RNA polymerase II subunit RPB2
MADDEDLLLDLEHVDDVNALLGEEEDAHFNQNAPAIDTTDIWEVISSFFRSKGLVHQQLDSFNQFLARIPVMARNLAEVIPRQDDQHAPGQSSARDNEQLRVCLKDVQIGSPSHENELYEKGAGPPLFPNEARLRDMTYAAPSQVTVQITSYINDVESSDGPKMYNTHLGRIPIMLKSMRCNLYNKDEDLLPRLNECMHDQGGYFIINGTEKVMIGQERQAANHVYSFRRSRGIVSEVKSIIEGSMNKPRTLLVQLPYKTKGPRGSGFEAIETQVAQMESRIPLFVLYRALDMISDKEILQTIVPDMSDVKMLEMLRPAMDNAAQLQVFTQEDALWYIGKNLGKVSSKENLIKEARELLARDLLPHMGVDPASARRKCFFIGYMVHHVLLVALTRRDDTDRDMVGNKRLDLAGTLLGLQFNGYLVQIRREMMKMLREFTIGSRTHFRLPDLVKHDLITRGLRACLATGNFGGNMGEPMKTGVSQTLNRLTYSSALSNLRRIQNPIDASSKVTRPRNLHCTQWGYICPVETPEGGSIGLLKNMALMCLVSVGSHHDDVVQAVESQGVLNFSVIDHVILSKTTPAKVFVNGTLIGVNEDPDTFLRQLRRRRRMGQLSNEVSIIRDIRDREIRVWSDAGRALRPLFVVDKSGLKLRKPHMAKCMLQTAGEAQLNWELILTEGFVDLIDCEEEDSILIAMRPEEIPQSENYSHCELDPAMIFGIAASIIPFPNHNQSPRNTYQSAMGKQAMGIYASNFKMRMDTTAHVLYYPQKPLVRTKSMSYMHSNDLPAGHNAVVAIACYSGYNQEDSVVMSKSAIDRGFFRSVFWRSYKSVEEEKNHVKELFENPDRRTTANMRNANYGNLDHDGLVHPGVPVYGGDIIVGKTAPLKQSELDPNTDEEQGRYIKTDNSLSSRPAEKGIVDSVMLTENEKGYRFTKVKLRTIKIPNIGDKFCSRHGQKGTCGIQLRQEDLPFTRDGVTPDFIINPHAIPSRMTVAHLIETLAGKVACMTGTEMDATPFGRVVAEDIAASLHGCNFQRWGNECLYNGHTGLPLDSLIFFGPTYYQRLKHLSGDKIHARPRGPLQNIVRQPTHGRAHQGGLRFGEMERDCMLSYGSSQWLRERLFRVSDYYAVHVCKLCGTICAADTKQHDYRCNGCDNDTDIAHVLMPYACKLLFQEMMAMSIMPRMTTGPI